MNNGAMRLNPPTIVPCESFKPRLAHACSQRFVGCAYRYLPSRISTHTETPSRPFGINRPRGRPRDTPRQLLEMTVRPVAFTVDHAPVRLHLNLNHFTVFGPR